MGNTFADTVRSRREQLGLTQRQVGQQLGVTAEAVHMVERGKRHLDLDKVPRLAEALEMGSSELCRQALEEQSPIFYAELVGEPFEVADSAAGNGNGGDKDPNRVLVELDREDAGWVRRVRQLDSRARYHLRELADRLATTAPARRR